MKKNKTVKLYNNKKGYFFKYDNARIYLHDIIRVDNNADIIGVYGLCNVASLVIVNIDENDEKITYRVEVVR